MRKGKYHTRRILKSIRVRALSAIAAFVLIGVVPAFFNMGYDSAKAAFIKTVDSESIIMPMPRKASYAQIDRISRERFSPFTQNFLIKEQHNSWYETKYQHKTLTAVQENGNFQLSNIQLNRDNQEEYYMLTDELVSGRKMILNKSNTITAGSYGSSYKLSWTPTGKVNFYDANSATVVTRYSNDVSYDIAASSNCIVGDEVLDIKYDDDNLYASKNVSIKQFEEYNSSYLWEQENLVLNNNEVNIKDASQVVASPHIDDNNSSFSLENNNLVYRTTLTGYGNVVATESTIPGYVFVKKSDLDRYCIPTISGYDRVDINTYEMLKNNYAIATFEMPFIREDLLTGYIFRQDATVTTSLFWDGNGFYALAYIPSCYTNASGDLVPTDSYTFNYKLTTNKVNPNDTMIYSGNVSLYFNEKSDSTTLKYQHQYNENNKKNFELTYSTDVNYYTVYPDYYYGYVNDVKMGEFVPCDEGEEHIVYLDEESPVLKLPDVDGKRIVDVVGNTKYRVTYEDLCVKDNQYISAILYSKDDLARPIMYARLCEPTDELGEFSFVLPEQIEDGEYIIGFFTEYLEGVDSENRYLDYMSKPVFCEMSVGSSETDNDIDGFRFEYIGSVNNPLLARDKYGIWWNYTCVKKYQNDNLIEEYIDRIWMPNEHDAFIKSVNQALADPTGMNGKLVLPSYLTSEKIPVKGIGGGTRETVILPTEINDFSEIVFPEYLEKINDYAFYECRSNYELNLSSTIKNIGKYAFAYNNIRELFAEGRNLKIDSYAFMRNYMLQSVHMDYTNELKVDYRAFYQCKNIRQRNEAEALFLSAPKLTLGEQAFANSMQSNMGAGVTISSKDGRIGKEAFRNTMNYSDRLYSSKLNLIDYKGVIEANAFNGAAGIKSLYIPRDVVLAEYAFNNLEALSRLQCDASVITDYSFCNCPQIVDVIFGENVLRVCPNWMGSIKSNVEIAEVNIAILNSATKFEFKSIDDEIFSSFGVSKTDAGSSRKVDTVNLFYNAANIARTAQLKDGMISDTIHALNMSNVEYSNIYKAGDSINNIIWIPSDQFNSDSFGYKAINKELDYVPVDNSIKTKNIYVAYDDNNKAINNTELKKDLFKVYIDENMQEVFEGEWLIIPRSIYKNLDKNIKSDYDALLDLPETNHVVLSDNSVDVTVIGFLNNEVYKGVVTVLGQSPVEALEDKFGDLGLVYEKIATGEEALNKLEQVNKKLNESIISINELNSEIASSNEEILQLTSEIDTKNQEIARLQEASSETTADIIALQKEADLMNQEIIRLNETIDQKTNELEDASKRASAYSETITSLNKQIDEYVASLAGRDDEISSYKSKIDALQRENIELKNKLNSTEASKTDEENTNDIQNNSNNNSNIDDLAPDNNLNNVDNANNSSEIIRLTTELNQAKTQVASLKNEYDLLKGSTSMIERENSELKNSLSTLQKEFRDLKAESSSLEKENNTLKSSSFALEKENTSLKTEAASLAKENTSLKADAASLTKENTILKEDAVNLEKENNSLKKQTSNFEKQVAKLQNNASKLDKENKKLGESNDKLSNNVANLSDANQKLKNQRDNLQNNANDWKEKYTELKDNSIHESIEDVKLETQDIKTDSQDAEAVELEGLNSENTESENIDQNAADDRIYYTGVDMEGNSYSYYITDDGEIIYEDNGEENSDYINEDKIETKFPTILPTDVSAEDVSFTTNSESILSDIDTALMDDTAENLGGELDNKTNDNELPVGKIILGVVLISGTITAIVIISKKRKTIKNTAKK